MVIATTSKLSFKRLKLLGARVYFAVTVTYAYWQLEKREGEIAA